MARVGDRPKSYVPNYKGQKILNPKRVWPKYNRYAKTQSLAPNNKTQ